MRKRDLKLDTDYVVVGDFSTPHRLVSLKADDQPHRVVTRVPSGHYYTIHPAKIVARFDDPEQVAARQREADRQTKRERVIDLAERLGFTVARDEDGWVSHRDAEARWTLGRYYQGRDILEGVLEIDLDAWLRVAEPLAILLDAHDDKGQHHATS